MIVSFVLNSRNIILGKKNQEFQWDGHLIHSFTKDDIIMTERLPPLFVKFHRQKCVTTKYATLVITNYNQILFFKSQSMRTNRCYTNL